MLMERLKNTQTTRQEYETSLKQTVYTLGQVLLETILSYLVCFQWSISFKFTPAPDSKIPDLQ